MHPERRSERPDLVSLPERGSGNQAFKWRNWAASANMLDVTARSLAQKVFQQYVGRTLSAAVAIAVAVYFVGVPVLTIVCGVAAVLVALWWLYFMVNGPRPR